MREFINKACRIATSNDSLSIDVANVGAGVDKALVELQEEGGGGSGARRLSAEVDGWAALTTCLPGAA